MLDREAHRTLVAEVGTGDQRVLDVRFDRVGGVEHRRHAALGVVGAAFGQRSLGEYRNLCVFGESQGEAEAGGTAADDQHVESKVTGHDLEGASGVGYFEPRRQPGDMACLLLYPGVRCFKSS